MPIHRIRALCAGFLLVCAASASAAGPINVHVRVEGAHKTLVTERTVTLADAPLTPKDGNPAHTCSTQTGAGALQQGSGGDWGGTWNDSFGDYLVDTIKGEKHPGSPDYWAFWVDNKQADAGVCQTQLKAGDSVLFFVDRCVYDATTQGCKNKPYLPLAVMAPATARVGHHFTLRVVEYSAKGKASPVGGATVVVNGHALSKKTDSDGHLVVSGTKAGEVTILAHKAGLVVSAPVRLRVRSA